MIHLMPEVQRLIEQALAEDEAFSDPTTSNLIGPNVIGVGLVRAKAAGVLAGVDVALAVFRRCDPSLDAQALMPDGSILAPGGNVARVEGPANGILRAERTALNFLQRMSGIATDTARYVKAVDGTPASIVDTRKTAPGHRYLDKYAVRSGGGGNHRMNLADGVLIKDNHIAAMRSQGYGLSDTVKSAVRTARHTLKVEVEVTNLEELQEAIDAGAHIIMLDNMSVEEMRRAVELTRGSALLEASGGIDISTVRAVAETGVDIISIGALTHSPRALDMSLDLEF